MKNLEQENKVFFDRIAGYYDNRIFNSLLLNPVKKAVKVMNIKKNSKILDVGCGTGNLLKMLENEDKNLKLYGIDISKEMLKIARKKLKNTRIKLESAEKLSFRENYFDYVFSVDAFHHYNNQDLVISNFYKILKKGGYLAIADFNCGSFLNKIIHRIEPGNNKMYTALGFKELFKEYKFKDIKQKRLGLFNTLTMGAK